MLNPTRIMADALGNLVEERYLATFGRDESDSLTKLRVIGRLVLELIANSDAPYHNVQHTVLVTQVGQEILRGRHLAGLLRPDDWLHFTVALLCHDIGYVRGVCLEDTATSFVADDGGKRVTPPRGATDAFLTPYHVDRGKIFVQERFGHFPSIDEARVVKAIELTRFPVPDSSDHQDTRSEAGLVRAADLIGQLADPRYLQKLSNLYFEFVETGTAGKLGLSSAADLADHYPSFYWNAVQPYIADALEFLQLTEEGKQWIANLHSHVFAVENRQFRYGPFRGDE